MRKVQFALLALFISFAITSYAQLDKMKIMDDKCKELVRVIGSADTNTWRTYIKENYAESLINKHVNITSEEFNHTTVITANNKATNTLEAKVNMYKQLHDRIGQGKIKHLRITQGMGEISLKGENGDTFNFELKFSNQAPYLINGLSVKKES